MNRAAAWLVFVGMGSVASWEDYKKRRVGNRLILIGIAATAGCYAYWALNTCLGSNKIVWHGLGEFYLPPSFYRQAATHVALSFFSAVVLWYLRVWPAGDAKFFTLCAALLPLMNPNLRGFPDHLVLLMLIDIFVPSALVILAAVLAEWVRLIPWLCSFEGRTAIKSLADRALTRLTDELPRAHKYAMFAWNTFALFFTYRLVRGAFIHRGRGVWEPLTIYVALYLVWSRIRNVFIRWDVAGFSFCSVSVGLACWCFFNRGGAVAHVLAGGKMAVGFWLFLPTASIAVDYYLKSTRAVSLEVSALAPGMILSEESWENMSAHSAFAGTALESGRRYVDGLSGDELALLQSGFGEEKGRKMVVYAPKPFAGWVFLGCLWAVLCRRTILECVVRLF